MSSPIELTGTRRASPSRGAAVETIVPAMPPKKNHPATRTPPRRCLASITVRHPLPPLSIHDDRSSQTYTNHRAVSVEPRSVRDDDFDLDVHFSALLRTPGPLHEMKDPACKVWPVLREGEARGCSWRVSRPRPVAPAGPALG